MAGVRRLELSLCGLLEGRKNKIARFCMYALARRKRRQTAGSSRGGNDARVLAALVSTARQLPAGSGMAPSRHGARCCSTSRRHGIWRMEKSIWRRIRTEMAKHQHLFAVSNRNGADSKQRKSPARLHAEGAWLRASHATPLLHL